jgi:single-strand DNA-binding protein
MSGVNKVILIGNLGGDVITRALPSGAKVASFSVATSERWMDKTTRERQERVEWHDVSAFGNLAEIAVKHLKRGTQVYIEGNLRTRKWQDKTGQERRKTEIVAKEIESLWAALDPASGSSRAKADPEDDIPW